MLDDRITRALVARINALTDALHLAGLDPEDHGIEPVLAGDGITHRQVPLILDDRDARVVRWALLRALELSPSEPDDALSSSEGGDERRETPSAPSGSDGPPREALDARGSSGRPHHQDAIANLLHAIANLLRHVERGDIDISDLGAEETARAALAGIIMDDPYERCLEVARILWGEDPPTLGCRTAWREALRRTRATLDDLGLMCRRLVRRLRSVDGTDDLVGQATGLLARSGLIGSPMREDA